MHPGEGPQRVIFSDMDGTLLDHHSYRADAARSRLQQLAELGIPVILVSSKTRSELQYWRESLALAHPFIAENGAAIYVPEGYAAQAPPDTQILAGFHVKAFGAPRAHWQQLLATAGADYRNEFRSFAQAGTAGVADMTGLPLRQAALANQRDWTETVQWLGSAGRKREFIAAITAAGACVQQGGRFLSIGAATDKGVALRWLQQWYSCFAPGKRCYSLAAGDGANDLPMLEAADIALQVRSPAHAFPALRRQTGIIRSTATGPAGWHQGVGEWLQGALQTHSKTNS